MKPIRRPRISCLFILSLVLFSTALFAKKEEWADLQGNRFKAEASQVLGPFAIFKPDRLHGRRLLLDQMSPENCVRFAQGLAAQPARAEVWSESKSELGSELVAKGCRQKDGKFLREDFGRLVEPEVFVVVYMTSANGDAWRMLGGVSGSLSKLMKEFPGLVDGYFYGFGHKSADHHEMVKAMGWPGLVHEMIDQEPTSSAARFMAGGSPNVVVLTRQGVPLFVVQGESDEDITTLMNATRDFLRLCVPDNPKTWPSRAHYARAVRPVLHARTETGPLLLGSPLRADSLVQRNVSLVHALIQVDAQGKAGRVDFAEDSQIPAELRTPLAEALGKACVFAPAIRHGTPVEGVYSYYLDLRGKSGKTELSDLVGATDLKLDRWLVLKPLKVEQIQRQSKLEYNGELDDGTLLLKPVYVGSDLKGAPDYASQKKAFLNDYFDTQGGATAVLPREGERLVLNGVEHTWTRLNTGGNPIDFQKGNEGLNWVIAYAYTELTVPAETKAYFSFGSDDCARIWVNGRKVHEIWANRPVRIDDDLVPVTLQAGTNRILVKVQNFLMPQWGMHLHVLIP